MGREGGMHPDRHVLTLVVVGGGVVVPFPSSLMMT